MASEENGKGLATSPSPFWEMGERYSIFGISSFMAHTWKAEVTLLGFTEDASPIFKFRGKRKLQTVENSKKLAVFKGWGLELDSDGNAYGVTGTTMRGNACFNFVGSKDFVKGFIERNQLNPNFDKSRVLAVSATESYKEEIVFPETVIPGNHAVIDRLMKKSKE